MNILRRAHHFALEHKTRRSRRLRIDISGRRAQQSDRLQGRELTPFLTEHVFRTYVDPTRAYEVRRVDASILNLAPRLDMGAKLSLAACLVGGRVDPFGEKLYFEHLSRWNGFFEEEPRRTSSGDFLRHFRETVSSIRRDGFRSTTSLVPVDSHMTPIDGSHRIAACLVLNEPVAVVEVAAEAPRYDAVTFQPASQNSAVLSEEDWVISSLLLKFADTVSTARIAVVFPAGIAADIEARTMEQLPGCKGVAGGFTANLSFSSAASLVEEIYLGEEWAQERADVEWKVGIAGWSRTGVAPIRVLVLDVADETTLTAAKRTVRESKACRDGLHIVDGHTQARRLAWTLLPSGGWWLLHRTGNRRRRHRVGQTLARLRDAVDTSIWLDEAFVDGSFVMELAGLRPADDIDIAALRTSQVEIGASLACLGRTWSFRSGPERCDKDVEAMTRAPDGTCLARGVRTCTPDALVAFKKLRMEVPKDAQDVTLLERALSEAGAGNRRWI